MINRGNPAKIPVWQKNPPKYTAAYIVQQSNSRWHCELQVALWTPGGTVNSRWHCELQVALWTYLFLWFGLNNENRFPPSLSDLSLSIFPTLILPSPNPPSRLLSPPPPPSYLRWFLWIICRKTLKNHSMRVYPFNWGPRLWDINVPRTSHRSFADPYG